MSKYFQPLINFGPNPIKGSTLLADPNFWFDRVKVLERDKNPQIVRAKDIPKRVIQDISNPFNICGYKKGPLIMGVLNLSPDSFSETNELSKAKSSNSIMNLVQKGADIIDIGGQSTKPNFDDISSELEKNRIKKILK